MSKWDDTEEAELFFDAWDLHGDSETEAVPDLAALLKRARAAVPTRTNAIIRLLRRDLKIAQGRETELVQAAIKAVDRIDNMGLTQFQREQEACAILEAAIGRKPRT